MLGRFVYKFCYRVENDSDSAEYFGDGYEWIRLEVYAINTNEFHLFFLFSFQARRALESLEFALKSQSDAR